MLKIVKTDETKAGTNVRKKGAEKTRQGEEREEETERRDGTNERKERRSWHSVARREEVVFRDMYRKTASNQDLLYAGGEFRLQSGCSSSRWKRNGGE